MNPGTFYLYEYENKKRTRNVGFIRVSRHYRSCILQINARGIPAPNGTQAELYAFFRDDDHIHLTAARIAALNCFRGNISARLPVAEASFPEGRPLLTIDGFLLKLPGERNGRFWMASAFFFDADIRLMHPPSSGEASAPSEVPHKLPEQTPLRHSGEIQAAEKTLCAPVESPDEPLDESSEESFGEASEELPEESFGEPSEVPPVEPSGDPSEEPPEESSGEPFEEPPRGTSEASPESPEKKDGAPRSARKIRREDLSLLPRKFWPLASNSFLLHGYHCYGHLLLAEENGRLWLGVPGIYDAREARAADLFGFPRFTRAYAPDLGLAEEERSDSNDFGHWCRCVGPAVRQSSRQ